MLDSSTIQNRGGKAAVTLALDGPEGVSGVHVGSSTSSNRALYSFYIAANAIHATRGQSVLPFKQAEPLLDLDDVRLRLPMSWFARCGPTVCGPVSIYA